MCEIISLGWQSPISLNPGPEEVKRGLSRARGGASGQLPFHGGGGWRSLRLLKAVSHCVEFAWLWAMWANAGSVPLAIKEPGEQEDREPREERPLCWS